MSALAMPQLLHSKVIGSQLLHVKQAQQSPFLKIFDNLSGATSEVTNFVWFDVSLKEIHVEAYYFHVTYGEEP